MTNDRRPIVERTDTPGGPKPWLIIGLVVLVVGIISANVQDDPGPAPTIAVAIGLLMALYGVIVLAIRAGRRD